METVTNQITVFGYTILTGALAGLFYDIYAGMTQVMRLRKAGVSVGDLLFWLVLTPVVFYLLLYYNQGEVRFYVFLGLGVGAALYFGIFRHRIRDLVVKVVLLIMRFIELVVRVLTRVLFVVFFPFRILYLVVSYPFKVLGVGLRKLLNGLAKLMERLVPLPAKKLYRRFGRKVSNVLARIRHGKKID